MGPVNVFVAESAWETLAHVFGPPPSASGLSCDEHGALLNEFLRSIAFFVVLHVALLNENFSFDSAFLLVFRVKKSRKAHGLFLFASANRIHFVVMTA